MTLATVGGAWERLTLRSVRHSQALVIAAVDRLARNRETDRPRPMGRLWSLQLVVAGRVLGEPATVFDPSYLQVQRLVALHREFVHLLFEALDTREPPQPSAVGDVGAKVIPLASHQGI
jgi:hypothetical protein